MTWVGSRVHPWGACLSGEWSLRPPGQHRAASLPTLPCPPRDGACLWTETCEVPSRASPSPLSVVASLSATAGTGWLRPRCPWAHRASSWSLHFTQSKRGPGERPARVHQEPETGQRPHALPTPPQGGPDKPVPRPQRPQAPPETPRPLVPFTHWLPGARVPVPVVTRPQSCRGSLAGHMCACDPGPACSGLSGGEGPVLLLLCVPSALVEGEESHLQKG